MSLKRTTARTALAVVSIAALGVLPAAAQATKHHPDAMKHKSMKHSSMKHPSMKHTSTK
jgi:hypothetical protein